MRRNMAGFIKQMVRLVLHTFSNIDFIIFTVGRLHPQLTTNCSQLEIELTVGLICVFRSDSATLFGQTVPL